MKNFFKIAFSFLGIWFLAHSIFIIFDGLNDKNSKADVAIVLGNKVNEDGTLSDRLKARLDKSIEIYKNRRVKKIIVSGGLGKEGFWEANEMAKYLIENQISNLFLLTSHLNHLIFNIRIFLFHIIRNGRI